jgi:DnaJ-class molecular chaperone
MTKDYYETLGVKRDASKKEIQSAFRRLARQYHPDVKPGDKEAEKRFKEVSEAHGVLSDPEKRRQYDQFGPDWQTMGQAAGPQQGPQAGPNVRYQHVTIDPEELREMFRGAGAGMGEDGGGFGDIFGSVFGRGRARERAAPPPSELEHEVTVSLREAYLGTHRRLELPDGRRVEITVPAGVADGTTLRVPGARVRVRISPDREFEREGKDLRVQVPVPLATALLGGEVEVPTLKGNRVTLRVPPETQNGTRLRLRGLGMPEPRGGEAGNLYAEVKVRLPLPLDERTRKWAEELQGG